MNSDFQNNGSQNSSAEPPLPPFPWSESIEVVLARYERRLLDHALANANGVKRRAAALLGISRYALERRLARVARTLSKDEQAKSVAAGGGGEGTRGQASSAGEG
jgi:DNA-binding NtrC family response regulator